MRKIISAHSVISSWGQRHVNGTWSS